MPTLIPNAKTYFADQNGRPLAGGKVYFYLPGTETKKDTFQDRAQTIPNTNPVVLDSFGEAVIWGTGTYRQVLTDANDNQLWDQITEDTSGGLIGNMTDNIFRAADGDFVPGTTTQLTLSAGPGSIENTWIYFGPLYQTDDGITLDGTVLTFPSAIPVGVDEVTVKIGSTIAIGTPGAATVTDSSVAPNAGINSSKLSFLQRGGGAVARTVQNKLYEIFSVTDFGAKGDGTTDDTTAIQNAENAVAAIGGGFLMFPEGTYLISNTGISKASKVDWIGSANGASVLKAAASVFSTAGMVNGSNLSGFEIDGIVFDFSAASGDLGLINLSMTNDYTVQRCQFVGNFKFGVSHNGGDRFIYRNNKFLRTAGATSQNQGLLVSTSAGPCRNGLIESNYHLNTGMDLSCQYTTIRDNQTYNWQFGAGITIEQNDLCSDLKIIGNTNIGGAGTDVNNTVCLGIENWAPRSQIIGNTCSANAGDGISNGGQDCQIIGNACVNNGQVSGNGITSRYTSASINGNYSTIAGNCCIDTQGSHTQSYGYADFNNSVFGVFLSGNVFTGNKLGGENILGTTAVATPMLHGSVSVTPGTLANGASAGGGFALSGSAVGDMCVVGYGADLQGVKLSAWVNSANNVNFRFENNTGASVSLGTQNIYIGVFKRFNAAQL
ncbi:glycosyl hydrolase family 28-related protein [Paraburkholderia caribensis]|uniref:glycosyl hydrolase family 28-related protein n=1 Tax=Paraburkholderia caribensis TaxID=75105 RepID=UPI0034D37D62